MISKDLITQVQIIANGEKVPWDLLCAIIERESAGDTYAVRYEGGWRWFLTPALFATKNNISASTERTLQQCSWGLCQVMGSVARELGFEGPLMKLCEPAVGILYGAKKIRQLLEKYGHDVELAVSSFNQGAPYKDETGNFQNQSYVSAVVAFRKNYIA
jgi:soluble lytic murein transglycosylase-like protein